MILFSSDEAPLIDYYYYYVQFSFGISNENRIFHRRLKHGMARKEETEAKALIRYAFKPFCGMRCH